MLEAPYTEAVDHRPPLTQMHELERTSLRVVVVVALLLLLLLLLSSHWEGVQRRMAPGLRTPFVATLRQDGYDHHAGFWTTNRRRQIYADERQNGNDSIEREPSLSFSLPA